MISRLYFVDLVLLNGEASGGMVIKRFLSKLVFVTLGSSTNF